ncbi:WXG100 family type VII secretion target [Mycobacterium sp. pUA109]|uniref:WXG100 family type VII secretion target n=1 Tax=Mycobacterium sp. pUA109 TaxID=3238982 RepID=UPI00351BB4CA
MSKFAVDPEKLAAAVTQMGDFHKVVAASVADAQSLMARLSHSWEGEAAAAGQDAHRRLHAGAEQMGEALGQLQRFLDNAHDGYKRAITGNSQMWGVG